MEILFSRKKFLSVLCIVALTVFVTSCNKDDDIDNNIPVAAMMAVNLVPDQPAVNIILSNNLLPGSPLPYTSYTGTYLNIIPGNRLVRTYSNANGLTLDSSNYTFQDGMYYSLFTVGNNNNYKNVITVDNFDSLNNVAGNAYVRYINAIPDSSASMVNITGPNGSTIVSKNTSFKQYSNFMPVAAGQLGISIMNNAGVNASRNITLQQQKAYTILFAGVPNATDTTERVQIRFIENGTLTD